MRREPEDIDAELRAVFAGLADVLIPAEDGMPSAGEVALERGALDAVLAVRPDVTADLGPPARGGEGSGSGRRGRAAARRGRGRPSSC